jgi:hypothetical protein
VEGAVERIFPDSARPVLDAAVRAVTDEGIGLEMVDERRGFVESAFVDVGSLRPTLDVIGLSAEERRIKFQFRALPTFGGTRLIAEAIYRPLPGSDRAMERMVPEDHPGRRVLADMLGRIEERLKR